MARPAPDAGPVGHRDAPYSVIAAAVSECPGDERSGDWRSGDGRPGDEQPADALRALAEGLRPHATGGSFLNFLTDPARTRDAYTAADHARLGRVKKAWDPENVFGRVHNIPPS
jgi:hypothetical protein